MRKSRRSRGPLVLALGLTACIALLIGFLATGSFSGDTIDREHSSTAEQRAEEQPMELGREPAGRVAETLNAPHASESPRAIGTLTVGRVVDGSGRPVSGVAVEFQPATSSGFGSAPAEPKAISRSDGSFSMQSPRSSGRLIVSDDRFVTLHAPVWFGSQPPEALVVVVSTRCSLSGRVLSAVGEPVQDAEIVLRYIAEGELAVEVPEWGLVLWRGATDADGSFADDRVPCVPSALLVVEKPGFPLASLERSSTDWTGIEVQLGTSVEGQAIVRGLVLDPDGRPVEGAFVGAGGVVSRSGAQGRFEVACEARRVPLRAAKPGFGPAMEWIDASQIDPHDEVTLTLSRSTRAISGIVEDQDGRALPDAAVLLLTESPLGRVKQRLGEIEYERAVSLEGLLDDPTGFRSRLRWVHCDEAGRFEIDDLADRDYSILLLEDVSLARRLILDVPAGTRERRFVLPNQELRHVAGQVTDLSGRPIEGATITPRVRVPSRGLAWLDLPERAAPACTTDSSGRFDAGRVVVGDTSLWVDSGLAARAVWIDLGATPDPANCRIELAAQISIRVELVTPDLECDGFTVADEQGEQLVMKYDYSGSTLEGKIAPIRGSESAIVRTSELARTVVILLGGVEQRRTSLEPDRNSLNVVRF